MTVTGENENNIKGEKGENIIMETNKTTKEQFYDHAPLAAPEDDSDDNLTEAAAAAAHYSKINEINFALINQTSNNQLITFSHDTTPIKIKLRHRRDPKGQQST